MAKIIKDPLKRALNVKGGQNLVKSKLAKKVKAPTTVPIKKK